MLVCGYFSARSRAEDVEGETIAWLRELLALPKPGEPSGLATGSGTNG